MFAPTWNKYMPIIRIFLKRAASGPVSFDMNRTDFERAAGGRKVKYTFTFSMHKGKLQIGSTVSPLAKDLAAILQEDAALRPLIRGNDYEFSMTSGFQLTIKNTSTPVAANDVPDTGTAEEPQ